MNDLSRRAWLVIGEVTAWIVVEFLLLWLTMHLTKFTASHFFVGWAAFTMGMWAAEWRRRVDKIAKELEDDRIRRAHESRG